MVMANIDILEIILCKMQEKTIYKQILVTPKKCLEFAFNALT